MYGPCPTSRPTVFKISSLVMVSTCFDYNFPSCSLFFFWRGGLESFFPGYFSLTPFLSFKNSNYIDISLQEVPPQLRDVFSICIILNCLCCLWFYVHQSFLLQSLIALSQLRSNKMTLCLPSCFFSYTVNKLSFFWFK